MSFLDFFIGDKSKKSSSGQGANITNKAGLFGDSLVTYTPQDLRDYSNNSTNSNILVVGSSVGGSVSPELTTITKKEQTATATTTPDLSNSLSGIDAEGGGISSIILLGGLAIGGVFIATSLIKK